MRRWFIVAALAALLLLAIPAMAYHEGVGTGDPPNRRPIANGGPDRVIPESTPFLMDASNSIDPDPQDDLIYEWSIDTVPPGLMTIFPAPNEFDLEDWQMAWYTPYLPPGSRASIDLEVRLTVYDRAVTTVNGLYPEPLPEGCPDATNTECDDVFAQCTEPDIICDRPGATCPDDLITVCDDWDGQVARYRESIREWKNHRDTKIIKIKVINVNQPPHGFPNPDIEAPNYMDLEFCPDAMDVVKPPADEALDWDPCGEGPVVFFRLSAAFDDEGISTARVYLYPSEDVDDWETETGKIFRCEQDVVPSQLEFGMGRAKVQDRPGQLFTPGTPPTYSGEDYVAGEIYHGQANSTNEREENWEGRLDIMHPDLVAGDYRVCARAFDAKGGNGTSDPEIDMLTITERFDKGQSPPCMTFVHHQLLPAIKPDVPEDPVVTPVNKFECNYPRQIEDRETCKYLKTKDGGIFEGVILGAGGTLRADVQILPFGLPGDEDYDPETDYLIHKVTFQNDLTKPGDGNQVITPETELAYPWVIHLGTIAEGTQKIILRAYDRAGGVSEMCVPVIGDAINPRAMDSVPDVGYVGVPMFLNYYVQDMVEHSSNVEIRNWDLEGKTYISRLTSNPDKTDWRDPDTGHEVRYLPALSGWPEVDIDSDGYNEVLYDSRVVTNPRIVAEADYAPVYDRYFDYITEQTYPLRLIDCNKDRIKDYLRDDNGNKKCEAGEPVLFGANKKDKVNFPLGFVDRQGNKELPQEIVDFVANYPSTLFKHQVIPDNLGKFRWSNFVSDTAASNNMAVLTDIIEIKIFFADTGIANVTLGEGAPYLPGDLVFLNASLAHVDGIAQWVELPMFYGFDLDPGLDYLSDDLDLFRDADHIAKVLEDSDALFALADTPGSGIKLAWCEGETIKVGREMVKLEDAPCALAVGESVNITRNGTFLPGRHEVVLTMRTDPVVNETDLENNRVNFEFEVYLGRTVVKGDNKVFHIRANDNGLPRLKDGVINEATKSTYDMALHENGQIYQWKVANVTYTWNPDDLAMKADNSNCLNEDTGRIKAGVDQRDCRPITVCELFDDVRTCWPVTMEDSRPMPDDAVDTPGLPLVAIMLVLGAMVVARRRQ